MSTTRLYCSFFIDKVFCGLEVDKVQEVLRPQPITRVPLAPPIVRGLINLRGQIVTAIDLRQRLGMSPRTEHRESMNIVIRTEEGIVSLLVDDIGDVIPVDDAAFENVPDTLRGAHRELINGVCKLNDRLLLVLNTEQVMRIL